MRLYKMPAPFSKRSKRPTSGVAPEAGRAAEHRRIPGPAHTTLFA